MLHNTETSQNLNKEKDSILAATISKHSDYILTLEQDAPMEEKILLYVVQLNFNKIYFKDQNILLPSGYSISSEKTNSLLRETFSKEYIYKKMYDSLLFIPDIPKETIDIESTALVKEIWE